MPYWYGSRAVVHLYVWVCKSKRQTLWTHTDELFSTSLCVFVDFHSFLCEWVDFDQVHFGVSHAEGASKILHASPYHFCLNFVSFIHLFNYMTKTRNMFCGKWYLPHSQVHNERTVPIIMAGCITHAQNSHISISTIFKSDITSCSSTPISFKMRKFPQIGNK